MANTCKTCKFYTPSDKEWLKPFGSCSRWKHDDYTNPGDLAPNEIVVENDEGWGALMGPDFGCVLWEAA